MAASLTKRWLGVARCGGRAKHDKLSMVGVLNGRQVAPPVSAVGRAAAHRAHHPQAGPQIHAVHVLHSRVARGWELRRPNPSKVLISQTLAPVQTPHIATCTAAGPVNRPAHI